MRKLKTQYVCESKEDADKKFDELKSRGCSFITMILSRNKYYVETTPQIVRSWETTIQTFEKK